MITIHRPDGTRHFHGTTVNRTGRAAASIDAQVAGIKDEMLFVVLGQNLEVIVLGHGDGAVQGGVDQLPDTFGVSRVLMLLDVDANEWHERAPQ